MPHAFNERMAEGALLCDGAMGTVLYARGVPLDACFDVLNLHDPKTVQSIHREYVAAGSDLIETNTFGANRFKLAVHGLDGRVREINRAGARLARDVRETMGKDVLDMCRATVGRHATVDDIAPVISFLGSQEARWITGQDIQVDGGFINSMLAGTPIQL